MHEEFPKLLQENFLPLQRYVNFKINNKHDAIANHKINDYYRKKAKVLQIPLESLSESALGISRFGVMEHSVVRDTLELLGDKAKQILYLYYFKNLSQEDIAKQLSVPIGTVKSRLHYAKERFKQYYPYQPISKGEKTMKKLPKFLPEYKIEKMDRAPFAVKHEELPGMFVVPRIGETISFGMYDMPSRKQNGVYHLSVTGKIRLHGIEGVTIQKEYHDPLSSEKSVVYAQLTDTNCKYLGGMDYDDNGNQQIITFLDDDFKECYGIGEDNCGFPIHRVSEGKIQETADGMNFSVDTDTSDIVGCFLVKLGENVYETVRLVDFQNSIKGGMLVEYYLDKNGRTILWRRFNADHWAEKRYGKSWTEILPENERMIVNGEIYVHWYDCVTDYIL